MIRETTLRWVRCVGECHVTRDTRRQRLTAAAAGHESLPTKPHTSPPALPFHEVRVTKPHTSRPAGSFHPPQFRFTKHETQLTPSRRPAYDSSCARTSHSRVVSRGLIRHEPSRASRYARVRA